MIQHLVLSGGANIGFMFVGTLQTLLERNIFNMQDIQSIHATSIGTTIGTSLSLGYTIDEIKAYMINRPWHDLYKINVATCYTAIQEGGFFGKDIAVKSIEPFLLGKNLSIDITLAELYEFNKIEIHFYATEFSSLSLVDISYKTHPEWTVVESIYASSCLPILCRPFLKDNKYYIDGAVLLNYPLLPCLENVENENSILGLYYAIYKVPEELNNEPYSSESSYKLLEYAFSILMKLWDRKKYKHTDKDRCVLNQIPILCNGSIIDILRSIESKEERIRLYNVGVQLGYDYINQDVDIHNLIPV
jgi:predicted acylesterase/phospholipase RssA